MWGHRGEWFILAHFWTMTGWKNHNTSRYDSKAKSDPGAEAWLIWMASYMLNPNNKAVQMEASRLSQ